MEKAAKKNSFIINSEGKLVEVKQIFYALCKCGQPISGEMQMCSQCVKEQQVIAQRFGPDGGNTGIEFPTGYAIINNEQIGLAVLRFDTATSSFVPFVPSEQTEQEDED